MEHGRCLICGGQVSQNHYDYGDKNLLGRQLSAVFILRKLLNLPLESLEKCFQLSIGEDPASWVTICGGECQEIVDNAQTAYQKMCRARQRLEACQKEIQDKIRISSSILPLPRESRFKIFKVIRESVNYKKNITERSDDYEAGDRMAHQLLTLKQAISKQPKPALLKLPPVISKVETESSEDDFQDDNCFEASPAFSLTSTLDVKPDLGTISSDQRRKTTTKKHSVKTKCPQCDFRGNYVSMRKHKSVVHPQVANAVFQCPQCPQSFNTRGRLTKHRWNHHMPRKIIPCPHCDYTTRQGASHLKRHIFAHHEKRNKCSVNNCALVCKSPKMLRDHQIKCHGREVDIFQCPECENCYRKRSVLKNHLVRNHGKGDGKINVCDQCSDGRSFLTRKGLTDHLSKYHKIKQRKPTATVETEGDAILGI